MRMLVLALPLCLSACAPGWLTDTLAPPYEPEAIRIYDNVQYSSDVNECRAAGANYKPHFHIGTVVAKTVDGAASNSSLIPINPLVPAAGAAGAAISSTADGLDVMSGQHANVFRNCLRDETRRDRSAIVADPRD